MLDIMSYLLKENSKLKKLVIREPSFFKSIYSDILKKSEKIRSLEVLDMRTCNFDPQILKTGSSTLKIKKT